MIKIIYIKLEVLKNDYSEEVDVDILIEFPI